MKVTLQFVGWKGFFRGPKAFKLAWCTIGNPHRAVVYVRPPFHVLLFGHARIAHELGYILTQQGNQPFHHPRGHLCGRVGHALRIRGRTHLPPGAWHAAAILVHEDVVHLNPEAQ